MDRFSQQIAAVVRGLAGLLARERREWVHALLAETR